MKLALLQARCSSTRLPGKVMMPLMGKPMILRQIERIRHSKRVDQLVVATSTDPSDDELVSMLESERVMVRRGPLDDVLARFTAVVDELDPGWVVRLTGDNPLVDPSVIDAVIEASEITSADYTSNSLVRTFPYGLDVECVRTTALKRLKPLQLTDSEKEHVTLGIYSRPEQFSIHQVTQTPDRSQLRWTVDYPQDFAFVEAIYSSLYQPEKAFGQEDIVRLMELQPSLQRTMADIP